jgi:cell division protein FtsI (penicillin-binding protein 3)
MPPRDRGPQPRPLGVRSTTPRPRRRIAGDGRAKRTPSNKSGRRASSAPCDRARRRTISPRRLIALFLFLVLAFVAMAARLVVLQAVEAPAYARLALRQREHRVTLPAHRGSIFDRNGQPLAISVDLQTVFADPQLVNAPRREAAKLAPVLGKKEGKLAKILSGTRPGSQFEYVARDLDPRIARQVKDLHLAGIYLRSTPHRYYPGGELASQLVGFVRSVDGKALAGTELQYNHLLEGRDGEMDFQRDPQGRPLPQAKFSYRPPVPGRSLFLTIDKDLQYFTQEALARAVATYDARWATAVVMQPHTGQILAMASVPSFNANHYSEAPPQALANRAVTDVFEPGSVFKLVTASGALQEHLVTPQTKLTVPYSIQVADRVIHDSEAHPTMKMTVKQIIDQSSNVGTIKIGMRLGKGRLQEYIKRFGFGTQTGLDFPGESRGIVLPTKDWSGSTIANVPMGQGVAVTALQLADAYGAIANGGVWKEPKLLYGSMSNPDKVVPAAPPASRRVVSRATDRAMVDILRGVVSRGTGASARIPGYQVAGKTGTAQEPRPRGGYGHRHIASFAGFAPASRPRVVVLVILDNPTPLWGGSSAAPTFQTIMKFALRHLGVPPVRNPGLAARHSRQPPPTLSRF